MAEKVVSVALQAKVQGFVSGMQKAKASVDDLTKAAAPNKAQAFEKLADKAALAGIGVATAVGVAVKRFADFDQAMSAVKANSGATGAELDALRASALKLGADSQFSATEAAQGINELAKAGVEAGDVLGGGLKGALDLAAAGQIGVAEASETAATAMTQFGLKGDKVPHIADLLANAANKAQGGVSDMGQALKQAGLVAASTGLSIEETTAGLTAFAAAGLIGSDAGTAFKTMLQRLSAPTDEAKAKMDELGISAYDNQGNFVGLANVAGQLKSGMANLTPEVRNAALATIFGSDAVRAANVLYDEGADGIRKWTDEVSVSGAAAKQAATLTDNLKGDIERLGGALDSVLIESGSGANGALRGLVQGLTGLVDAVGKVPGPILLVGGALTATTLLLPKAILSWRAYQAQVDAVTGSNARLAASMKAAQGALVVLAAGTVAAELIKIQAAASVADVAVQDLADSIHTLSDGGRLSGGIADLFRDKNGIFGDEKYISAAEAIDRFSASAQDALGDSLYSKFVRLQDLGGTTEAFEKQVRQLDGALAQMVASGNAEGATQALERLLSGMDPQVAEQARKKFTEYAGALDTASTAQANAADSHGLSENLQAVKKSADDARDAVDKYIQGLQDAGLVVLDARSANREFEQSIDDVTERLNKRKDLQKELAEAQKASADTNKDGKVDKDESKRKADDIARLKKELDGYSKGFDVNTEAGRNNQAALDKVAQSALDLAKARYEEKVQSGDLDGAERVYRDSLVQSRDQLIKTGAQMGLTKAQAKDYADQILQIPPAVSTTATFHTVGLADLKAAGEYLKGLRDKNVKLTVGTIRTNDGSHVNAGQFADGGYTGDGAKYEPAGIVHRGEYVFTKAATSTIGKATLDYLHAHGKLPGYANGGYVAGQFAPAQLVHSSSPTGLGRQFVSGSLDLGDGLRGFVRAIVADEMTTRPRQAGLVGQNG